MLDIDNQENRSISILAEDLVNLNVMSLEGIPSGIPSNKFLALTDLNDSMGTLRIISNIAS